jgi:hypothetical protein
MLVSAQFAIEEALPPAWSFLPERSLFGNGRQHQLVLTPQLVPEHMLACLGLQSVCPQRNLRYRLAQGPK